MVLLPCAKISKGFDTAHGKRVQYGEMHKVEKREEMKKNTESIKLETVCQSSGKFS